MELISRDEVLSLIKGVYVIKFMRSGKTLYADAFQNILKAIQDDLEELPIIESRPKGEWINQMTEYEGRRWLTSTCKCSICGDREVEAQYFNFCPNCGADMRGEE